MSDDIEVYLDSANTGSSYLESLIRCQEQIKHRQYQTRLISNQDVAQLDMLHEVIMAELDLALLGTSKAKSEILKATKDNVKPINPGAA